MRIQWLFSIAYIAILGNSLPTWATPVLSQNGRPAVLFLVHDSTMALLHELDRHYLRQLEQEGFRVSYEELKAITAHKLQSFHAVVLCYEPGAATEAGSKHPGHPQRFATLLQNYVSQGGGVFLLPWQIQHTSPFPLLSRVFGFQLSPLSLQETDPAKQSTLVRGSIPTAIAWTDQILPSAVSQGVQQLWYMYGTTRHSRQTGILDISSPPWQIVVRASATAFAAKRIQQNTGSFVFQNTAQSSPPLFAIRSFHKGRVALFHTWYHGLFGQGTKWIFNRQILQHGSRNKPSHAHRLFVNTLRWLSESTQQQQRSIKTRTSPRSALSAAHTQQRFRPWSDIPWTPQRLQQYTTLSSSRRSFRGIIGLRSTYSTGYSTLEQYKEMALRHNLDFLILLEDYQRLTPQTFRQLRQEAMRLSDHRIVIIPGYRLQSNIGNHVFLYGRDLPFLPKSFVRSDGKLFLQPQNAHGQYIFDQSLFRWILHKIHGTLNMFGFYDMRNSGWTAMQVKDLRLYSALAVRYYQNHRLVENLETEYLQTTGTGSPPTPLCLTDIDKASDIPTLLRSGVLLTHIVADNLQNITTYGHLFWNNIYTAPEVYISNGPHIKRFAHTFFYRTYGALPHVTGRALQPVHIVVESSHPIRKILLYNGGQLFRSIQPDQSALVWSKTLLLSGNLQKNLVLQVTDHQGRSAISFPHRSVKDGHADIVFCGDHINDCVRYPLLARGPFRLPLHFPPMLSPDEAGWGWDGGPIGSLDLLGASAWNRVHTREFGVINLAQYNQTPIFHFSDEGSLGVESVADEIFAPELLQRHLPLNPWFGYAPKSKAPHLTLRTQLRFLKPIPSTVPIDGHAFYGGSNMSLAFWYDWTCVFLRRTTVQTIELFGADARPTVPVSFVSDGYERGSKVMEIQRLSSDLQPVSVLPNQWFAFFSSAPDTNTHLFFNAGRKPFRIHLRKHRSYVELQHNRQTPYQPGEQETTSVLSYAFGVKTPIRSLAALRPYIDYLQNIPKPIMAQGSLQRSHGVLRFKANQGRVAFALPQAPTSVRDLGLPVQIEGLIPTWTAGLLQKQGYLPPALVDPGRYAKSAAFRYRPLGVDPQGMAWFPLEVSRSKHDIEAGHPLIASWQGRLVPEVAIQVTPIRDDPYQWYVAVNHLGTPNRPITVDLQIRLSLPQFPFRCRRVTLQPHQHLVVSWFNKNHSATQPCATTPH